MRFFSYTYRSHIFSIPYYLYSTLLRFYSFCTSRTHCLFYFLFFIWKDTNWRYKSYSFVSSISYHFSFTHCHSFFSSIFLSRSPLSLLLISNNIFSFLLTLFTFTRSSLYYLHSVSCILLPILTLLSSPLLLYLLPLHSYCFSLVVSPRTLPESLLSSFSVSIHLSLPASSSRFTSVDRDRINRCRQGGMSENRLVDAIIGRARGGKLISWWGSVLLQYLTNGRGNQYRSPLPRLAAPSNSTNLNQSQPKYGRHTARDHFVFLIPLDSIDDISHVITTWLFAPFGTRYFVNNPPHKIKLWEQKVEF